ncbi:hypothetical protein [Saccharopolyspora sp. CA-218241]|uniref:hypothetical protein n=1 Tax=Saccharopolyspora sp. CA-218241 TaxID=3240027 RepID=UPI003D9833A2
MWSDRLHQLGVSPGSLPCKRLDAPRLPSWSARPPANPACAPGQVAAEDGAAGVITTIHRLLDR